MPNQLRNLLFCLILSTLVYNSNTAIYAANQKPLQEQTQNSQPLINGKPVKKELKGGQADNYIIKLSPDQYLELVVEQQGIDVVVTLFNSDNQKLVDVDSPNGARGDEPLYYVSDQAGDYRLEVRSLDEQAAPGNYQVNIKELRAANQKDRPTVKANYLIYEGQILELEKKREAVAQAIAKYQEALTIFREIKDRAGEGRALYLIGDTYSSVGERLKALPFLEQALPIKRELNDRAGESDTLSDLGVVCIDLGKKQQALDYFTQALAIDRALKNRQNEGICLSNIGSLYSTQGDYQQAIKYFNQAIPIYKELVDIRGELIAINNIATAYNGLGEYNRALLYYEQALEKAQKVGNKRAEAAMLTNIGVVYVNLKDYQRALACYNQALPLNIENGNRREEANVLKNLGFLHQQFRESTKAIERYNQALTILQELGDKRGQAHTNGFMGTAYESLGQLSKSREFYQRATTLWQEFGDRHGEANAHYLLAIVERKENRLEQAKLEIEKSLSLVESVRSTLVSRELRATYFSTVQNYFDFYIDLLMQLHQQRPTARYDRQALLISEKRRARSLLELIAESKANIRREIDAALLEQERELQRSLNDKEQARLRLLNEKSDEAALNTATKELEALLQEYQQLQALIRERNPRYATFTDPEPLKLSEIQKQILDPNTVVLEYSLGETQSYLWLVTQNSVQSYRLPKQAEIEGLAKQFYQLINNPLPNSRDLGLTADNQTDPATTTNYKKLARQLSRILLAPVASQLGKKRLLIVADGVLHYLPFSALAMPGYKQSYRPLMLNHEVVSLPSASVLSLLRDQKATSKGTDIAIIADPIFDVTDVRVKAKTQSEKPVEEIVGIREAKTLQKIAENGTRLLVQESADSAKNKAGDNKFTIPRLPFTRDEANSIVTLAGKNGKSLLDFDANKERIIKGDLSRYRIVHFATHGYLDSERPELSALLLSMVNDKGEVQDGFLRTNEIFNLRLPCDLVVLSACETALGKDVRGEGLIGITRGFMHAGTNKVVVSLWSVNDKATSMLMSNFYQQMIKQQRSPSSALRTAQVELWRRGGKFAHPYYWAPFVIQGDFR